MNNYLVTIREILEQELEIEANSLQEAQEEAERRYKEQEIVLNADNYQGTEITVRQRQKMQEEEITERNREREKQERIQDKPSCKLR